MGETAGAIPSIDQRKVDELREIIEEGLDELIDDFLEHTPAELDKIQQAVDADDIDQIYRLTHTLKSSSGNIGMALLSELCRLMEYQARHGELKDAMKQVDGMRDEFDNLRRLLDK